MRGMKALRSLVLAAPLGVAVLSFLPTAAAADGGGIGAAMGNCLSEIALYEYWSGQCITEYAGMLWIDAQACANADAAKASMNWKNGWSVGTSLNVAVAGGGLTWSW